MNWIQQSLKVAKVLPSNFYTVPIYVQRAAILFLERHRRICTKESRIPIGLGYCIIKPIKSLALMKWNSPPFFVVMSVICLVRPQPGFTMVTIILWSPIYSFIRPCDLTRFILLKDGNEFIKSGPKQQIFVRQDSHVFGNITGAPPWHPILQNSGKPAVLPVLPLEAVMEIISR